MPKLSLFWPIDQDGYGIKEGVPGGGTSRAAKTIGGSGAVGALIVRNGGPARFYDPLKINGLYHRLAECPTTAEGTYDFVRRFGFLGSIDGLSERVEFICNEIRAVRSLLKDKRTRNWERLRLWIIDNPNIGLLRPDLLAGDPPELFFRPVTLQDAIYLQFFEDLTTSASLRKCKRPGCGEWFKYGAGTSHRNTAQFCSAKCQNADKYARRKEGAL